MAEVETATGTGENDVPDWILTASYFLHMLATALWVGGILFKAFILLPLISRKPSNGSEATSLLMLQSRFQPIVWLSLAILLGTGLTQMTAHPQYEGLLAVGNRWSVAIFVKHLSIVPMVVITAFQSFVLHPRLQRMQLRYTRSDPHPAAGGAVHNERRLILTNALLSFVVLVFTALARTS